MSSGNQVRVGQCGATSRTCSSSSLSLHSVCHFAPVLKGHAPECHAPKGQDVLDRLGLLLYRRELLGKALNGVAEQPRLGDGGVEEACLVDILHLCQVEPEMALLDHHGGTSPSRGTAQVTFVARRVKAVAVRSSCINPGSVLPSCTCLSALAW